MAIPAKPTIRTLPAAPQRTDTPAEFSDKADTFVAALPTFRGDLADAINWQELVFTETETVYNAAVTARDAAQTAQSNAETAQAGAETARDTSQQWATTTGATVDGTEYSAREYASGTTVPSGSAQYWSTESERFKNSAETAAASAQSSAGLPSLAGKSGQRLTVNATEDGVLWGGGVAAYQEFAASGTWNKDPAAEWVYVEAIGGGGGGESDYQNEGGGGGGAFASKLYRASDLADSVTVTVGSGGAGGATAYSGGSSEFATLVAPGGRGASYNRGGNGGGGELGGKGDNLDGAGGYSSGGGGGYYANGGSCVMGGAGGAGANRSGGVSANAGNGGDDGASGQFPGGGGGASGGSGGDGVVRVWQW